MKIKKLERKTLKLFQTYLQDVAEVRKVSFAWGEQEKFASIENNEWIEIHGLYITVWMWGMIFVLNLKHCCAVTNVINDRLQAKILKMMKTKAYQKCFKEAEKFKEDLKMQHSFLKSFENKRQLAEQFVENFKVSYWGKDSKSRRFIVSMSSNLEEDRVNRFVFVLAWENFEPVIETNYRGLKMSSKDVLKIVSFLHSMMQQVNNEIRFSCQLGGLLS